LLSFSPSSGGPGSTITVGSLTPCPAGSRYATVYLLDGSHAVTATANASSFDASGNWRGTLTVPPGAAAGSYSVTASCFEPAVRGGASDLQDYTPATSTPGAPSTFSIVPTLSSLRATPHKVSLAGRRVGRKCVKPTHGNNDRPHCRRAIKLEISYALDASATVTFALKRETRGRKSGGKCVPPTPKNVRHKRCWRLVELHGNLIKSGRAGNNSFVWNGKIGGHTLGVGSYQLIASLAGGKAQTVSFNIVR
jgi:hypothetical protein